VARSGARGQREGKRYQRKASSHTRIYGWTGEPRPRRRRRLRCRPRGRGGFCRRGRLNPA